MTSPLYDFFLYNDVTLNQDTNLNTTSGVDLSGHKLKVNGNLSVTGSNLNINRGTLETTGNCSIFSHIVMRNENDYILCGEDFTIIRRNETYDYRYTLTQGRIY